MTTMTMMTAIMDNDDDDNGNVPRPSPRGLEVLWFPLAVSRLSLEFTFSMILRDKIVSLKVSGDVNLLWSYSFPSYKFCLSYMMLPYFVLVQVPSISSMYLPFAFEVCTGCFF